MRYARAVQQFADLLMEYRRLPVTLQVLTKRPPKVARFTHVNDLARWVDHEVDAGCTRHRSHVV